MTNMNIYESCTVQFFFFLEPRCNLQWSQFVAPLSSNFPKSKFGANFSEKIRKLFLIYLQHVKNLNRDILSYNFIHFPLSYLTVVSQIWNIKGVKFHKVALAWADVSMWVDLKKMCQYLYHLWGQKVWTNLTAADRVWVHPPPPDCRHHSTCIHRMTSTFHRSPPPGDLP